MDKGKIYVERSGVRAYAVVKPGADHANAILPTQAEGIDQAREISPDTRPDVERVRYTSVGKPDRGARGEGVSFCTLL